MYTIINDTHLGVTRNAGTTPASQLALTQWQEGMFSMLLEEAENTNLIILGDLFDSYTVPASAIAFAYLRLRKWLEVNPNNDLYLVRGNHDASRDSYKLSSFDLLCKVLSDSERVVPVTDTMILDSRIAIIPHFGTQDEFTYKLRSLPDHLAFVLLHANYHNGFAAQSDHSLNVEENVARRVPGTLVFAHEHHHRTELFGKVVVIGNQIPTSIADCVGSDVKYYAQLEVNSSGSQIDLVPILTMPEEYVEVDWRELLDGAESLRYTHFVRVTGDALESEADMVVRAIAKFRGASTAFVVSNAVRIGEAAQSLDLPRTLEAAKAFDVLSAVLDSLTKEQASAVRELLAREGA